MERDQIIEQAHLRYHLQNVEPVDLMDFAQSLQALHGEYSRFIKKRGETSTKTRLNIQKVEEGSIVLEIIEALPNTLPDAIHLAGNINTLVEFAGFLGSMVTALVHCTPIPSEGRNPDSLKNISSFMQPLVNNAGSNLTVEITGTIQGNVYNQCVINIGTTEGNALQNQASRISEELKEEIVKTEERKDFVLLRLERLERGIDSKQDRGIIEEFDPKKTRKLLFDDDSIKDRFMNSKENAFKCLYYVDAIAMYQEGRIIAYRITNLHDVFEAED